MALTTPTWNATFAKLLLNQIIALVQRDQAAAIALVNPAITDSIVQFHKGSTPRVQLPHFTIWAERAEFDDQAQLSRRSRNVITIAVEVGSSDQELAQELAWDWARIIDMILTSATPEDWRTPLPIAFFDQPQPGTTSPPAQGALLAVIPSSITVRTAPAEGMDRPVVKAEWVGRFELEET